MSARAVFFRVAALARLDASPDVRRAVGRFYVETGTRIAEMSPDGAAAALFHEATRLYGALASASTEARKLVEVSLDGAAATTAEQTPRSLGGWIKATMPADDRDVAHRAAWLIAYSCAVVARYEEPAEELDAVLIEAHQKGEPAPGLDPAYELLERRLAALPVPQSPADWQAKLLTRLPRVSWWRRALLRLRGWFRRAVGR